MCAMKKKIVNKKNIIFISIQDLDERNYKRFGFNIFLKKGWNINYLYFRYFFRKYKNPNYPTFRGVNYKVINLWNFLQNIKEFSDGQKYFYVDYGGSILTKVFCYILYVMKNTKVRATTNLLPIDEIDNYLSFKNKRNLFISLILKGHFKELISLILNKISNYLFVNKPNVVIATCEKEKKRFKADKSIHVIEGHCMDYDITIRKKNNDKLDKGIVFIDQAIANHPDIKLLNLNHKYSYDLYWREISHFLEFLKKHYNLPISICAHPRNKNLKLPTKDFKIYYKKTPEIIAKSRLVVAHDSTAVNYAILYNKPIIFLTSDYINKYRFKHIHSAAKELGLKPINLNKKKLKLISLDQFNKDKYNEYTFNYIKTFNSPEKKYWDIAINALEKYLN